MEQVSVEKIIRHEPGKDSERPWALYTRDGSRLLGRHKTKEKALAQERAIWSARHRRKFALIIGERLDAMARAVKNLLSSLR